MIISTQLLQETERRYRERQETREENREKIAAGEVLEVNGLDLFQRRVERLARAEASAGIPAGTAAALVPGAPLDAQDTLGAALERLIGKSDLIGVNYLELGIAVSRTVGRIHARTATGRTRGYGTGFMVSPRLLLTNNHVLGSAREASNSWVEFNFQDDTEGRLVTSVIFDLEPESFFLTDVRLDYSLVAVGESSRDGTGSSLQLFGWNRLIEEQGKAIVGEHVNIVQHPNGEPKQLALRENQIVDELENFLHYETDTAPGSSGSPVFNDQWEVIALHHSGVPKRDGRGRLLTRDDTLWTPDMGEQRIAWVANEGARISRIVRHLKQQSLSADVQRRLRDEMFEAEPTIAAPPLSGTARRPDESTFRPAAEHPLSPSIGKDGNAVWMLPLQVSVSLGQQPDPTATSGRVGAATNVTSTSVGLAADRRLEAPKEDSEELHQALAELEEAGARTYYEEEKDREDREAYYGSLPDSVEEAGLFERLSNLLQRTHANRPKYQPAKHLYPWVDLRPDLKLRSVYSGREFDAEELIREDFGIELERAARLEELYLTESAPTPERVAQEIDALEATLPYNCEHVVPQSWTTSGNPCAGISTTSLPASRGATASAGTPPTSTSPTSKRPCARIAASVRRTSSNPPRVRGPWPGRRSTSCSATRERSTGPPESTSRTAWRFC